MGRINAPQAYKVVIMEFERGWGSKIDDTLFFDNEQEAKDFVEGYNKCNNEPVVPDWYMVAVYKGKV